MKGRPTLRIVHCGRTKTSPVEPENTRARNSRGTARESFEQVRFAERTFGVAAVSVRNQQYLHFNRIPGGSNAR